MAATARREFGDTGEEAAAKLLQQTGYRLLARNFRCRYGELDLVAERDDVICFVEVRTRATSVWGDPADTISFSKQRKVVRAALQFMFTHRLRDKAIRFDVVSVVGRGDGARVEHIPNAFDAGM